MKDFKRTAIGVSLAAVLALGLAACGDTKGDRAMSGAALGGAAGLGVGALTGSPLTGAALGAAGGAATGALTDKDQIDLGKPVWK